MVAKNSNRNRFTKVNTVLRTDFFVCRLFPFQSLWIKKVLSRVLFDQRASVLYSLVWGENSKAVPAPSVCLFDLLPSLCWELQTISPKYTRKWLFAQLHSEGKMNFAVIAISKICLYLFREVFKNPNNGNFPLRGLRLAEKWTEIS